jgi:hypothetical protein
MPARDSLPFAQGDLLMLRVRPRLALGYLACASLAMAICTGCPKKDKDQSAGTNPTATAEAAAPAKPAEPAKRVIQVNRQADAKASYIWLKTIELSSTSTTLAMQIKNQSKEKLEGLRVSPPGHADAFYIMSPDKKRFDLRSTAGDLPKDRQSVDLLPGQSLDFTLVFEPLDPSMTEFDLLEGANQDPKSTYWNFKRVKLK